MLLACKSSLVTRDYGAGCERGELDSSRIVLHTIAPKQALKGVHLLVLPKEKLPGGDTEVTSFGAVSSQTLQTPLGDFILVLQPRSLRWPGQQGISSGQRSGPGNQSWTSTAKHLRGREGHQGVGTAAKHSQVNLGGEQKGSRQ